MVIGIGIGVGIVVIGIGVGIGNQMTIPHIYVHVPSNIHSGSNPQET